MVRADEHRVIAISRQMGAGGTCLGQRIAKRMGISYFDRQILDEIAEWLQVSSGNLAGLQSGTDSMLAGVRQGIAADREAEYVPPSAPTGDGKLYEVQADLIRELAGYGDCVMVGRGATMALRGRPGLIRVFLHAPREWRIQRVAGIYGISQAHAEVLVRSVDAERERFYQHRYRVHWTELSHYDLALNISAIGFDAAERAIVRLASCGHAEAAVEVHHAVDC